MAKAPRRRRKPRSPRRLSAGTKAALFLLIVGAIAAGYAWHEGRSWRPDEAVWPDQGALIGAEALPSARRRATAALRRALAAVTLVRPW